MSMEQMGGFSNERLDLKNQMQMMLAKRHGEDLMEFIDKHAKDVGEYVDQHEAILDTFKTDPDSALKEVEDNLSH